jgi:putative nucleotidyltransferase with HDIG domain
MLAADFLKIGFRPASLAAGVIIALLSARTDFVAGFFMAVLFSFGYYSLHPGENAAGLAVNTAVFTLIAYLAGKLAPSNGGAGKAPPKDESEKEFVRKVTNSLMLAHEMLLEIKKGTEHEDLLRLMSGNIFSLLDVKQVMVYTPAENCVYRLAFSDGSFPSGTVSPAFEFRDAGRLAVRNINAGVLKLIKGEQSGSFLLIPSGESADGSDIVVLYRGKEFDSSEIYITEFFIAQVYAVIDKHRHSDTLRDNYEKVIEALSMAIDAKDRENGSHSLDTMRYAGKLAERLGLPDGEKEKIKYASLLHDIGKINISSSILNKPGSLTPEEYEVIKKHPVEGAGILKKLDIFSGIMPLILHHHEHVDGRGYPENLKGQDIPIGSRICAIADAYTVMRSERPYKKSMTKEEAVAELKNCAGTQFDPDLVDEFVEILKAERA